MSDIEILEALEKRKKEYEAYYVVMKGNMVKAAIFDKIKKVENEIELLKKEIQK